MGEQAGRFTHENRKAEAEARAAAAAAAPQPEPAPEPEQKAAPVSKAAAKAASFPAGKAGG